MGVRLHILAKELNTSSKELVKRCRERGIKVKSHLSSVPEPIADVLRKEVVWRKEREKQQAQTGQKPGAQRAAGKPRGERQDRGGRGRRRKPSGSPQGERPQQPRPPRGKPRGGPNKPAPTAAPMDVNKEKQEIRGARKPKSRKRTETPEKQSGKPSKGRDKGRRNVVVEEKVWRPPKGGGGGRRGPRGRRRSRSAPTVEHKRPESVEVELPINVRELSSAIGVKAEDIIRDLLLRGTMISINDYLSEDVLPLIGDAFSVKINIKKQKTLEEEVLEEHTAADRPEDMVSRAPVVTFLGHVDHGKTSLLDRIRRSNVTAKEFGGITQHIGAYSVEVDGRRVVFLDTPGHEAFTAMRARGANVTDVVVLVVAADDGVMPQTVEAINHAKAANVPIVVALNKIDKPDANPSRVKQQLSEHDLIANDWGGDIEVIEVSAITGQGLEDLLETLILEAEILELQGNPKKSAMGTVLEAHLSEGRGVVATVLVKDGTLRRGDYVICGGSSGKIRAIFNDQGRSVEEAGPASPVEISGLDSVPDAGDLLQSTQDSQRARELAEERAQKRREEALAQRKHVTLETLFSHIAESKVKEARVILKADVKGSVEVLKEALTNLSTDEVRVNLLHAAVGGVTESDVLLADASDAVIIAFQVVAEDRAKPLAEEKGVEIRSYKVIYEAVEDVKKALEGLLEPEKQEKVVGHFNVTNLFRSSKFGVIMGGRVTDGRITRNDFARLIRDSRVVYDGKILSLRREKDDVREVQSGFECGIRLVNFNDAKEGDVLETYVVEEIARKLS